MATFQGNGKDCSIGSSWIASARTKMWTSIKIHLAKSNPREELMRETSMEAFREIEHALPLKRKKVFEAIRARGDRGATLFELVEIIGRPVNELSGRVTELQKQELIKDTGTRINPGTNKAGTVWTLNEEKLGAMQLEILGGVVN